MDLPNHVAVIMDGNGRWATHRGLSRSAGHRAGVRAARKLVEAAGNLGIRNLTLYAFSSDNWKRPSEEVAALFRLLERRLPAEAESCVENGIRMCIIGNRERLPKRLIQIVERAERRTESGSQMVVRLAIDYSGREAILAAAQRQGPNDNRDAFVRHLAAAYHSDIVPDVDLLIRSGGERRLSDFLLWECAYAELCFQDRLFPDYTQADLEEALAWYAARDRRFGALPKSAASQKRAAAPGNRSPRMLIRDGNVEAG